MERKTGIILIIFLSTISVSMSQDLVKGKAIFESTCKPCHSIGSGSIVGPDLKDVDKRRSEEWILSFVKSPIEKIKSGDPEAKRLLESSNNIVMPDQKHLTDDDIRGVIGFIKESSTALVVKEVPKNDPVTVLENTPKVIKIKSQGPSSMEIVIFFLIGFAFLSVFICIILLLRIFKLLNAPIQNT